MKMLINYRNAFSLRDEIGEYPNLEADIKVIDDKSDIPCQTLLNF